MQTREGATSRIEASYIWNSLSIPPFRTWNYHFIASSVCVMDYTPKRTMYEHQRSQQLFEFSYTKIYRFSLHRATYKSSRWKSRKKIHFSCCTRLRERKSLKTRNVHNTIPHRQQQQHVSLCKTLKSMRRTVQHESFNPIDRVESGW